MVLNHQAGIFYKQIGAGKPIVFLHGFLEDHSIWNTIYSPFVNRGFSCILVDLPCHGLSRFTGDICTMSQMAQTVAILLEDLGIKNPFVFGHSMGGYVGLELLRILPARLTLVHSNFWADPEEKKRDRNRVIDVVRTNKARFVNEAIPGLFATQNRERFHGEITRLTEFALKIPASEMIAATAGMRDRKPSYDLLETTEVNIIQGDSDTVVTAVKMVDELGKVSVEQHLFTISNCGHMGFFEQPQDLIMALENLVIG